MMSYYGIINRKLQERISIMPRYITKKTIHPKNYVCLRMRESRHHKNLVSGFSSKNPNLARYLQSNAWFEDTNDRKAIYLVKDGEKIAGYFSFQSGMLIRCHTKILRGIDFQEVAGKKEYIINDDVIDVTDTLPAIEISHFCINENYKTRASNWNIKFGNKSYSVGQYIFLKFLAPKILETSEKIGVYITYLFCADDGTGNLIEYYNSIGFKIMDNTACIRSNYDSGLRCMTQTIENLRKQVSTFNDYTQIDYIIEYLKKNGALKIEQAKTMFNLYNPIELFKAMEQDNYIEICGNRTDKYKYIKLHN